MTTYSLTEARPKLGDIVRRAAAHQQTIITDHDVPVAVIVNFGDWEDMEDTIAVLSNRVARAEGRQPIPWKEAKAQLLKKMEQTAASE